MRRSRSESSDASDAGSGASAGGVGLEEYRGVGSTMRRLSNSSRPSSISPRIWSYDALRQAQRWVPVIDRHLRIEDRSRIGTIALPHYSPEHGLGMIAPQAPRRKEIGVWLYGIGATFDSYYDRNPRHGDVVTAVSTAFVEFDAAPRDWKRARGARAKKAA